jgi:membrane-bound inhibitor of C-type lysozyme
MAVARIAGLVLIVLAVSATMSFAQTYLQYSCEDGAQLSVAFVEQAKAAYVQLDGKSMILPQRLSASGARYKKSGVTFWIKGNEAQLKRPKSKWTQCKTG